MISIGVDGMGWYDASKSYELLMGMDQLMYLRNVQRSLMMH